MPQGESNFQFNTKIILHDLYRLVSIVSVDRVIFEMAVECSDPLLILRGQVFQDEIVHLLIGTAVANRIRLEQMATSKDDPTEVTTQLINPNCGTLWPSALSDKHKQLSLREACNKIIHAVHIAPEAEGDPAELPLGDTVILRGMHGENAWVAHLSIVDYVRVSTQNFIDIK